MSDGWLRAYLLFESLKLPLPVSPGERAVLTAFETGREAWKAAFPSPEVGTYDAGVCKVRRRLLGYDAPLFGRGPTLEEAQVPGQASGFRWCSRAPFRGLGLRPEDCNAKPVEITGKDTFTVEVRGPAFKEATLQFDGVQIFTKERKLERVELVMTHPVKIGKVTLRLPLLTSSAPTQEAAFQKLVALVTSHVRSTYYELMRQGEVAMAGSSSRKAEAEKWVRE